MNRADDLIVNNNPKSAFSESIKTIRTNLQFSGIDKDIKIILNTSPEPSDGKSFISANLAIAYAQEGKKVLIIDCDLRKGIQNEIFDIGKNQSKGYSNLILNFNEKIDLSKYFVKTKINNVVLLGTGIYPPNPVELLGSKNNDLLINTLRSLFDVIILDCPPVLGLNDTLILTKFSDANIVVVSDKKTKIITLENTIKAFQKVNASISGIVINKVKQKKGNNTSYYEQY
ncbi:MAG: CpsD/CapB family tyrosine-protein kinase [Bacilli bacterium]